MSKILGISMATMLLSSQLLGFTGKVPEEKKIDGEKGTYTTEEVLTATAKEYSRSGSSYVNVLGVRKNFTYTIRVSVTWDSNTGRPLQASIISYNVSPNTTAEKVTLAFSISKLSTSVKVNVTPTLLYYGAAQGSGPVFTLTFNSPGIMRAAQ